MYKNPIEYVGRSYLTDEEKKNIQNLNKNTNPEIKNLCDVLDKRKFKDAYLADCQYLVSTLQDLIMNSKTDFILFYKQLAEFKLLEKVPWEDEETHFCFSSGSEVNLIVDIVQSIFIKIASALDILSVC